MQWDLSTITCTHSPFQRGFFFFIFIASIYVVAYLIRNLVIFSFTKKGLGRIENSFKARNDLDFKNGKMIFDPGHCTIAFDFGTLILLHG